MARIRHMVKVRTGGHLTIRVGMRPNALGGWALGLGIASIFANCLSFGLILGIPAIVVGVLGVGAANEGRASNKGLSIAGVVTGTIGTVISAGSLILLMVMLFQ